MAEIIKILEPWRDHLIWCPSQCYLPFEFNGRYFTIYLRWRHNDPWTAALIETRIPNGDITGADVIKPNDIWNYIFTEEDFFRDEQVLECKARAIQRAQEYLLMKEKHDISDNS